MTEPIEIAPAGPDDAEQLLPQIAAFFREEGIGTPPQSPGHDGGAGL